ncbi:uncharacterized protein EDB93DRAFT_764757 [Suillus bovinus]|uniref:uncharacterized protein n=1 Tax=Suillus bovinus TaxID=48563 RepID=UPI001B86A79E|nr:uncharacterized protein EDB93DRAFT_764757 [Suillus bovinus]KAG2137403.1 hypothetical protein EDB93DRAFT_764757 [Suillus bovinus]
MPFCPLCPPGQAIIPGLLTALEAHIKTKHVVAGISCQLCQQDFKNNAALIQHLASKRHHKCKAGCSQTFMTTTELSTHIKADHNAGSKVPPAAASASKANTTIPVTFPCGTCAMQFVSSETLQHHMRVDHSPNKNPCPSCYQSFSTPSALEEHKSISHPVPKVQASVLGCPMCKQTFLSAEELPSHIRAAHPLEGSAKKMYPCISCERTFSKKSKLTAHNETAHPPEHVCAICRLKCPSKHALNDHVAAVHTRAPSICRECNAAFTSEEGLRQHYLHSSKGAHPKCIECNLGFENDAVYATHRQTSHPEPPRPVSPPASYHCPLCSNVFKLQSALDDHTVAKHSFTCGMCEFVCLEEEVLKEHIASAHSCPVCHEGIFANTDLLDEHLADHAAPYRCEVCQTRYAEEEGLRQHYRDSPDDIHPSCTRCNLGFQDAGEYHNHTETMHPQVSCQLCDGALFDPEELPMHYLTSRNHPACDKCQVGFSDQAEFAMVEHPEAYCHLCQWQFECPESLQNHIRHFVAHPKCMDCELRFADVDAYQHHLFVVHRPHSSDSVTQQDFDPDVLDNGDIVVHSEKLFFDSFSPNRVDSKWDFTVDVNYDLPCAPSIPLPPSTSGYSSPLSQRVLTRSSIGSRSSSRTLSPPPISGIKVSQLETGHVVDHSESPELEHSPLSNIPTVGTPLISSTDFRSPFSPRPDPPALFVPSQELNGASHSDQESVASARSPETSSPVIKLPENGASPVSSSGWSTLSGEDVSRMSVKSDDSPNHRPVGVAVPMLRLQVPVPNGTSQTASTLETPSSISPESAGIDISANVTPDYLREARAYLAVTHPGQFDVNRPHRCLS